jgi:hypothetical protein
MLQRVFCRRKKNVWWYFSPSSFDAFSPPAVWKKKGKFEFEFGALFFCCFFLDYLFGLIGRCVESLSLAFTWRRGGGAHNGRPEERGH